MQRLRTHAVDALGGIVFDQLDNRFLSAAFGAPPAGVSGFVPGGIYIDMAAKLVYRNTGTVDSSAWTAFT